MNETSDIQLPAEIEALEARIANVQKMQADKAAPVPHFRVPRLVEKPVPNIGKEFHLLKLETILLHNLTVKAAMKAVRYRIGAMCDPRENLSGQQQMLAMRGLRYRNWFFQMFDSLDEANLREGPMLLKPAEETAARARDVFAELAEAQAACPKEPAEMGERLF